MSLLLDNGSFIIGDQLGNVLFVDEDYELTRILKIHNDFIKRMQICGNRLYSSSIDHTLKVTNLKEGKVVETICQKNITPLAPVFTLSKVLMFADGKSLKLYM